MLKKRVSIFAMAFMLMGCATQETNLTEEQEIKSVTAYSEEVQETDKQKDEVESNTSVLTEYQAEQIIKEADNAIHTIMERADIYNKEQPEEEKVTVRIEKNDNGRWVITEMNQWYNDFRFNYMREMHLTV